MKCTVAAGPPFFVAFSSVASRPAAIQWKHVCEKFSWGGSRILQALRLNMVRDEPMTGLKASSVKAKLRNLKQSYYAHIYIYIQYRKEAKG